MNRLIKILGVLVFLVTFLQANQCIAVDYVYFTNPMGGTFYDCNNWTSTAWDPNDCNIPKIDFNNPDDGPMIGGWYEGGTTKGHLIVDSNLYTGFSVGSNIMGNGQVDVMPDANIQFLGMLTSSGYDCVSVVNVYGGAMHSPPTVPEYDGTVHSWSWLNRGGITYWNQYDGDVRFGYMNYWGEDGYMYINVSGGSFMVGGRPVPYKGKVYINVSGTGTVTIAGPWEEFLRPINPGGTWFTVNGGGTLILLNNWDGYDWVSDPTVNGTLSSDSNVTAEYLNGDTTLVKFTTDACGAIPDADMDKDCDVDFKDYASFAEDW